MIRKAFTLTVFILLFTSFAMLITFLAMLITPVSFSRASYGSDVTLNTLYIESSHYSTFAGTNAFDNASNQWYSGESGADIYGVSYIGQDFGEFVSREIRRVGVVGYGGTNYTVTSYHLQFSDNASDWSTCGTALLNTSVFYEQYANFDACGTHRYWRLLAGSNLSVGRYWIVLEIEMFEYIEDPTPTVEATPTNTPFPLAYQSTLSSGVAYEIERSATFGEIALFAIMAFISVILLVGLFVRISTNANTNS